MSHNRIFAAIRRESAFIIALCALGTSIYQTYTNRISLELNQRPYVQVFKVKDQRTFLVRSLGNTPAHDVQIHIGCVLFNGKYVPGKEKDVATIASVATSPVFFPGMEQEAQCVTPPEPKDDETVITEIQVVYKDVLDKAHFTDYCVCNGKDLVFQFCESHNNAN